MKITIELDPTKDRHDLDLLRAVIGMFSPVRTPPEDLDVSDSSDDSNIVNIYTSEGNEDRAKESCDIDEAVGRVEVEAEKVLQERREARAKEEAKPKKAKRRTREQIALDEAKESGKKVEFEKKGERFFATPEGEVVKVDLAEATVDESVKQPTEEKPKQVEASINVTSEELEEAAPMSALDEAIPDEPPKPKEQPKPDVDPAVELRKLMVQLVKAHGKDGTKMTADIVKGVTGQANIADVTPEQFPDVKAALEAALGTETTVANGGGGLDY